MLHLGFYGHKVHDNHHVVSHYGMLAMQGTTLVVPLWRCSGRTNSSVTLVTLQLRAPKAISVSHLVTALFMLKRPWRWGQSVFREAVLWDERLNNKASLPSHLSMTQSGTLYLAVKYPHISDMFLFMWLVSPLRAVHHPPTNTLLKQTVSEECLWGDGGVSVSRV